MAIRRLWPKTRRAGFLAAVCVVVFFVLNVLVLLGSELALDLLIFLSGMLAGFVAARLATYPFRRIVGSGLGKTVGLFVGMALVFVIIFGGTALAGIPPYPTAEGGNVGNMIYGLALGFLVGVPGGLVSAEARSYVPLPGSSNLKIVAVILGTVAALFGLLFVLFLLLEYALVPLIRAFAA
jgi:hypothetical protein